MAIVERFADATQRLQAVNAQVEATEKRLRVAEYQMEVAQRVLCDRAVTMYKSRKIDVVDVLLQSSSFSDLFTQIVALKKLSEYDDQVLANMERTREAVASKRESLLADRSAARDLVVKRAQEKVQIERALAGRKHTLERLRGEVRRLESELHRSVIAAVPVSLKGTQNPSADSGRPSGGWWPLIREAASANGIDANGLYRLMMIESGGSAAIVGGSGGRFCGLFQYWPGTWRGSWNPWRSASIFDGEAQIRATALAIKMGKGPYWWNPSYQWAFGTH